MRAFGPSTLIMTASLFAAAPSLANHIPFPPPPAQASLTFSPVGSQLDGDAIDDILTAPGAVLTFQTRFDTLTALGPLLGVIYDVIFDPLELALTPPLGFPSNPTARIGNPFSTHVDVTGVNFVTITHLAGSVPAGLAAELHTIRFTVLPTVGVAPHDGLPDVRIANVVPIPGGIIPGPIFTNQVEVQTTVPEPAAWLLLGAGALGSLALRRRRA